MKKFILTILLIISITITFSSSKITINNVQLSDTTLNNGESGVLTFTIENTYSSAITDCNIIIESELELSQKKINFKRLESGETRTVTLSYTAPYNIEAKTYTIIITANYEEGSEEYSIQKSELIKLLKNNQLIISNYTSNLLINSNTLFTATLINQGNSDLNNVFLEIRLPNGFIPEKGTQYYIPTLKKGENLTINSKIFLEKTIEPKAYTIEIIKKADNYNDSDSLNILAVGKPKLVISGINLDPNIPKKDVIQTISVQYENIGSGKAYNIKSELQLDEKPIGITTEYLGTLEGDDLTSAIFDFYPTNKIKGEIILTYNDENGNNYSLIQNINYTTLEKSKNNSLTIIGIIIGTIIIFLIYKKIIQKK